ncbi:MAG: hypothetical protein JHC33_02090 [Ignisphaera sp.]|nr:hypothetical protein [Ignisphaera sp.]
MTRKKFEKSVISVTLPYTLHDWSDSLTYDEIEDTLFLIGIYTDDKYVDSLSSKDKIRISAWLKKNDVSTFLKAKELASIEYIKTLENETYAAEIIGTRYKRPLSH